jgi:hypothetical protein
MDYSYAANNYDDQQQYEFFAAEPTRGMVQPSMMPSAQPTMAMMKDHYRKAKKSSNKMMLGMLLVLALVAVAAWYLLNEKKVPAPAPMNFQRFRFRR